MIRSRADIERNEKNSTYFTNLEKRKAEKKTIYKLSVHDREDTFSNDSKLYYVMSINYCFETGHLTDLQKQRIITSITTANKDTSLLTNWRPISLLNVDYKNSDKSSCK